MVDPGEIVTKTLIREFSEEALSHELLFNKESSEIETRSKFDVMLKKFFGSGKLVRKI